MNTIPKTVVAGVIGLAICAASSLSANPVTVQNNGTSPGITVGVDLSWIPYNGGAYAGVENLLVNFGSGNVSVPAYCIDLYHFSSTSPLSYNIDPLAGSPTANPPKNMGPEKADFIKEMWAQYYGPSLTDATKAGGFQLAIWGVLQGTVTAGVVTPNWDWLSGGSTTADTYGADAIISWANVNNGALADVVGLNAVIGGPQSYAIPGNPSYDPPGVPDGGLTVVLLGMGMLGLGLVRRMAK
jgi:hypothetical protein